MAPTRPVKIQSPNASEGTLGRASATASRAIAKHRKNNSNQCRNCS